MPITLGDTSITGLGVGGLPAGTVNSTSLADSAVTAAKMGYSGAIIQSVMASTTDQSGVTNSNFDAMYSHSITRISASNKILLNGTFNWGGDNPNGYWNIERSFNNSTWTDVFRIFEADEIAGGVGNMQFISLNYLDSPAATNATVYYRLKFTHAVQNGGTMYRNRPFTFQGWSGSNLSTWILSEVKA